MITIDFSKRGSLTLTQYLYEALKAFIFDGTLNENDKLPSKRTFANHLGVSVLTVQNAYVHLIEEGFLYSIEKKGFFVSSLANHLKEKKVENEEIDFPKLKSQPCEPIYFADFTNNAIASEKFPFSLWSKTMRKVLNSNDEKLLEKTDVSGFFELRRALCRHLKEFRNMSVCENQVIIGSGTESLYSMIVQFLGREEIFAVENPGYRKAGEIFRLNGAKCISVKIDEYGIDIEELKKSKANVVNVSPSHNFPSGITMNFHRRKELLDWAGEKKNRFIIEDEYDSEFRFAGNPLPTLQSIDQNNRVIYINTFSKTLSPSFRISYMVLPLRLAKKFKEKLALYSCPVSSFEQFTLARFISDGNYERHINRMKNYYRSLRNDLVLAFKNSKLAEVGEIHEENSGLHFLFTLKSGIDAKSLQEKWKKKGIKIQLLSDYYYEDCPGFEAYEKKESFIVNYSGIKKEMTGEIVKRLCECL